MVSAAARTMDVPRYVKFWLMSLGKMKQNEFIGPGSQGNDNDWRADKMLLFC